MFKLLRFGRSKKKNKPPVHFEPGTSAAGLILEHRSGSSGTGAGAGRTQSLFNVPVSGSPNDGYVESPRASIDVVPTGQQGGAAAAAQGRRGYASSVSSVQSEMTPYGHAPHSARASRYAQQQPQGTVDSIGSAAASLRGAPNNNRGPRSDSGASLGNTPSLPPVAEVVADDLSRIRFCVGLDFGTTYSGFAIVQMQKDPSKLQPVTPLTWPEQPPNVVGVKTPTISCYSKADHTLDSWGFAAMKKNTMKLHKIERVKLCLEPSTPDFLKPIIPEGLNADDIIRDYLHEIDRYCMETLERMWGISYDKGDIDKDEIMYCLTVPVNWSPESHQRLRRAAYRAGLLRHERSPNLVFCYEPEAASMACVYDPDVKLAPGSDFLVVDCGGGTVDLFQCRLGAAAGTDAPELVELSMGQGGFFGAANVDVAFLNHLRRLMTPLGLDNVSHSPRCAAAWNNLMSQWEYRKRSFTGRETFIDEIFIPQVILKELEETLDDTMPEALQLGTIELTPELMKSFFDPVLDSIIHLIQKQVLALVEERRDASDHGDLPPVTATTGMLENMFVVGGFGNNQYLRQRIADDAVVQRLVKRVRSIPSPEVAVLRGAVYAAVGDSIRSRRARRSIGVQILRPFDGARDLETDVVYRAPDQPGNAAHWLVDTYVEAFILKGEPVQMSSHYSKHNFSLSPGSWTADINIYASDSTKPLLHTRRDRCQFLGRVTIDARPLTANGSSTTNSSVSAHRMSMATMSSAASNATSSAWTKRDLSISIYFGRVELEVCVTDTETGRTWRTILGHGHIHVR
ncbi:hypothetical protein AMAG_07812 [Allomyces macrogynus ATCC 38327]|uniref:Hsp70-like protein n=1 Tax=Allomyces macrogynus (strain ATCC 38327) TaxID=578462 RepID=A0A0L0SJN8_ALLM3|nr:hypothetical protein AMAG_07812 [Allomyces macrogynus ATCC 38327]|eukprot:KNE62610.1 hypothetical protein AMAG_07812 [Allomyces macrogynus ATCC 38327]